ncbi:hypothetical protein ACLVWU_17195 [Bdellovibrio sp. HCB290]|uniref:hypothetical protein n=1 Tax=Bdellovibrio sp. HCB290 TaxID=3394356 RepID=UPI0039B61910
MKNLLAILLVSTFSWASFATPSYAYAQNPVLINEDHVIDYDFGEVVIGSGGSQSWDLYAPADKAIYISQITISGDDYWADTDCLGFLEAGYSCSFTLFFVPAHTGESTGSVKIIGDSDSVTFNVKGTGVEGEPQ